MGPGLGEVIDLGTGFGGGLSLISGLISLVALGVFAVLQSDTGNDDDDSTPSGRDIHKNGIDPDVRAKLSAPEIQSLRLEDLGTQKDSQYRVAESTLLKQVKTAGSLTKSRPYNPDSANVPAALAAPVQ